MKKKLVVAIFNSTFEIIELLRELLEGEGYTVTSALLADFKYGKRDLVQFMQQFDPGIIIYDLPPPYLAQLNYLHSVKNMEIMKNRRFVFTTTNKIALEKEEDGRIGAFELIGKPFDLEEILKAVEVQALAWSKNQTNEAD